MYLPKKRNGNTVMDKLHAQNELRASLLPVSAKPACVVH